MRDKNCGQNILDNSYGQIKGGLHSQGNDGYLLFLIFKDFVKEK